MSVAPRPVAVVVDGDPTPAWQARALSGLGCSPRLAVVEVARAGPLRRGPARRLHAAIERHLLRLGPDPLAPVALAQPTIAPADRSEPATLVVWLSQRPVPDDEPREVLYLRHAGLLEPAEDIFRRAVLDGEGWVETEVLLRRGGHVTVVERTFSGVRSFSATMSLGAMLWKLAALVPRAAERVPGLDLPAPERRSVDSTPSIARLIARSALNLPRVLATRLLFRRPWSIRIRERGREPTEGWSCGQRLVRFRRGNLYADPFLFEHHGRHHLFCEEVPLGARLAVISHTELHADGTAAEPPSPVIERPYHLSYPFVFAHRGEVYLIPETSRLRRVELYLAVDFPRAWRREAILLDGFAASDATLLEHGDRLWLFAAVAAPDASGLDELHLFSSRELLGPWRAHPRNPVVSDVRCARPAGAVQRWGSRLVRPTQDGSRRYGGAISFREIDVLSASEYSEHEIDRLEPGEVGDARATHTYSSDARFEAIDLRRREWRVKLRLAALAGRLAPS